MNLKEIYRAVSRLLDSGWTIPEIERLSHFRSRFQQTRDDLSDFNLDMRHLEFIRWLVQTGKLLDW
jgi:hypothetical protein